MSTDKKQTDGIMFTLLLFIHFIKEIIFGEKTKITKTSNSTFLFSWTVSIYSKNGIL